MMRYVLLLGLSPALFGQSSDAVLTQTLISEIHALRQEIEATTITAQRVQIALYRLQSQTAIVAAAQQRLDGARLRSLETQKANKELVNNIASVEETIRNSPDPNRKKEFEDALQGTKRHIESLTAEEAQRRSAESEAESQFRAEQARLAELQSVLDRLDKALDELSRAKR